MFENFIVFTEVVKLSSNIFWKVKEVNYSDKLLDLIYEKKDVVAFEEVINLVDNKFLITMFIEILQLDLEESVEKKWIENIFKVIEEVDTTAFGNELLMVCSYYEFYDFVKYLIEHDADVNAQYNRALNCSIIKGNLEIVKLIVENGYYFKYDYYVILHYAKEYKNPQIVEYLEKQIPKMKFLGR